MSKYKKRFKKNTNEKTITIQELRINENITAEEIRLIDHEGVMVGITTVEKGIELATENDLDLVEIGNKAVPAICKILDYDKYRYHLIKKEKEHKANQHLTVIKPIRIQTVNINQNDLDIKLRKAKEFLENGNKVKFQLQFKGREIIFREQGFELLKKIYSMLKDIAVYDSDIQKDNERRIHMILKKA